MGEYEPLYLTDAQRPLMGVELQDRYRFYAVFRLKGIQYTRWFTDPGTRQSYVDNLPGGQTMSLGEAQTYEAATMSRKILEGISE